MAKSRKQIIFDLDIKSLEKYYPSDSWRRAYYDIKSFMSKNGFEWVQGSGYVSKKPILHSEVIRIINDVCKQYKWINLCMRDCRVTNVGREFDITSLFDKSANVPTRAELQGNLAPKKGTMSDWKKRIAEQKNNNLAKDTSQNKSKTNENRER